MVRKQTVQTIQYTSIVLENQVEFESSAFPEKQILILEDLPFGNEARWRQRKDMRPKREKKKENEEEMKLL